MISGQDKKSRDRGFSLIETLVSVAVFLIIIMAVYQSYVGLLAIVQLSRVKIAAADLANERFEILRNMPYAAVGLSGGVPAGALPRFQTLVRDGITFYSTSSIQNVDDPFDGTAGGLPNDTSPADYKRFEIEIGCPTCRNYVPLVFTAIIAPKNLEAASTNGSLFVRAFDRNGLPIPQASVHIVNSILVPPIDITEQTNNAGVFQLIDAPPSIDGYQITVSKNAFSTDKTYAVGGAEVEVPLQPHSTIAIQQVTQTSFAIDKTGTIEVSTVQPNCAPVANVSFSALGTKSIGTTAGNPVLKYSANLSTNGSGLRTLSQMEWDTYLIALNDATYDLAGTVSQLPISLAPDSTANAILIMAPKNPKSVLLTIKDAATGLPITAASVRLTGGGGYDETLITGRGFLNQTDWSGGSGQGTSTDLSKYFSQDGNIADNEPGGELRLSQPFHPGPYQTSGYLTSSTFDTGSPSNFYQLLWSPISQPVDTGTPNVRFQLATNNDTTTWNFVGPDGTAGTYYDSNSQNISEVHNNDRYLRYKVYLDSASDLTTPSVADVSFTYTSLCVPPGQALFSGLSTGDYDYEVSKTNYQTSNGSINVSSNWKNQDVTLQPE